MNKSELIDHLSNLLTIRQGSAEELVGSIIEVVKEEIQCPYPEACIKPKPTPELIQGYTAEQWQEIIDGGYLCEFSGSGNSALSKLEEIKKDGTLMYPFQQVDGSDWTNCRPAQIKGVMRPIFVEPVDMAAMCGFFSKDGYPLNEIRSRSSYSAYLHADNDIKGATKYIEL